MKKIKSMHSNKDLIICVSIRGQHEFFYQAVGRLSVLQKSIRFTR